jgi:hypothetical protein
MTTKKHPVPAYLDDEEFEMLQAIVKQWGGSLSGALKRLIREKSQELRAGGFVASRKP